MAYLIKKRVRWLSGHTEYEIVGVCNNKDIHVIRERYENDCEESSRLKDLYRQQNDLKKKIEDLKSSRIKIEGKNFLPDDIKFKVLDLERLAHRTIDKEINEAFRSLNKIENEITEEKSLGCPYSFEEVDVLRG